MTVLGMKLEPVGASYRNHHADHFAVSVCPSDDGWRAYCCSHDGETYAVTILYSSPHLAAEALDGFLRKVKSCPS